MTLKKSTFDSSLDFQPRYSHIEIRTISGGEMYYFVYNPYELSYVLNADSYTSKFLESNKEITEILRVNKVEISGKGKFITLPEKRNSQNIGTVAPFTAVGQWKEFEKLFYEKVPLLFINPIISDQRKVVFLNLAITQQPNPHVIEFTFQCKETDSLTQTEISSRNEVARLNNSQCLTQTRVTEIETNMGSHYDSISQDWDQTEIWGKSGKIPGTAEFLVVEYYADYRMDIANPGAATIYADRIKILLEQNNKCEVPLSAKKTNKIESIASVPKKKVTTTNSTESVQQPPNTTEYIKKEGEQLRNIAAVAIKTGLVLAAISPNPQNDIIDLATEAIYQTNKASIEKAAQSLGFKNSGHGAYVFVKKLFIPNTISQ